MKHFTIYILLFLSNYSTFCQIGIGTTNPDINAILDITSNSKGVQFPRLDKNQIENIVSTTTHTGNTVTGGLTIFCTDCCENRPEGSLFFYNGAEWISLDNDCRNTNFPICVNITTTIDNSRHLNNSSIPLFFDGSLTSSTQQSQGQTKLHKNGDDQVTFKLDNPLPVGGKFQLYWSDIEGGIQGLQVFLFNGILVSQATINTIANVLPNSTNVSNGNNDYILTITLIAETDSITIVASPTTDHPKLFEFIILDDEDNNISSSCN